MFSNRIFWTNNNFKNDKIILNKIQKYNFIVDTLIKNEKIIFTFFNK